MVKRFCAVCGAETDILIDNLCVKCYRESHPLAKVPHVVRVIFCRNCLSYYSSGKWVSPRKYDDLYTVYVRGIRDRVARQVKALGSVSSVEVFPDIRDTVKDGSEIPVTVVVRGSVHKSIPEYEETYSTTAVIAFELCPSCRVVVGKKERAIVQVRAQGRKLTPSEMSVIKDLIERELEKLYERDKGAVALEVKEGDGALDIFLASQHAARRIAYILHKKFSAQLLESSKMIGVSRTGKPILKPTIRVLLPPFRLGDIIEISGRVFKVLTLSKGSAKLLDLSTYKEENIPLSRLFREHVKLIDEYDMGLVMSISPPSVMILNLTTYSTLDVYMPKVPLWVREGEKVVLVKSGERVYVAPVS